MNEWASNKKGKYIFPNPLTFLSRSWPVKGWAGCSCCRCPAGHKCWPPMHTVGPHRSVLENERNLTQSVTVTHLKKKIHPLTFFFFFYLHAHVVCVEKQTACFFVVNSCCFFITVQRFGISTIFLMFLKSLMLTKDCIHLIWQYSKNSTIVKYYKWKTYSRHMIFQRSF